MLERRKLIGWCMVLFIIGAFLAIVCAALGWLGVAIFAAAAISFMFAKGVEMITT